jgi:hypothetical protein
MIHLIQITDPYYAKNENREFTINYRFSLYIELGSQFIWLDMYIV